MATMFAQFVSGYTGRSAEHRGQRVEDQPLWSLPQLQELLEEWITAKWQNRQHDGLRDPLAPGRAFSPNEKYAALVESAGYLPLALSAEDYLKLLPTCWRAVNSYGIKINRRIYDCAELDGLRREKSGLSDRKDRWEVRHDPYDIRVVWVRDHREDVEKSWITVPWRLLSSSPVPFGEMAWDHSARDLREQGQQVTEEAIAGAVDELLDRAGAGPAPEEATPPARGRSRNRRASRAAARTRAAAEPAWPRPDTPSPLRTTAAETAVDDDETVADVVPLRVFDARKEAKKWW